MATPKKVKVMVFGTFDGIHPGHRNFFAQAKKLADDVKLVVSVARDENVTKIKGKPPRLSHFNRKKLLENLSEIDKVIIGGLKDHMPHIVKEKPDIIALGYDQKAYVPGLKESLKSHRLLTKVVRLKPYKPHLYKNSFINN